MDPKKLLYLAEVIENGSFKKAAQKLLISQPALSTSMSRLEQSLGEQLLIRSPRGVTPTPIGELLYAHARLIREKLQLAEQRIKEASTRKEGTVTFGALPSLADTIVPRGVCRWRNDHLETNLRIYEKVQLELLLSLVRGELDFIIAQPNCHGFLEGLRQRVLFRDRLYVIANPRHPAFGIEQVQWSDLARYPWVVQMIGNQRLLLEQILEAEAVQLQLTECSTVNCIKALVAESNSLALLPASAIATDVRGGRIKPIPISGPLLNRDIAVLFREVWPLDAASRALVTQIASVGLGLEADSVCAPTIGAGQVTAFAA